MKHKLPLSKVVTIVALAVACTSAPVWANATLTPTSALKTQGITSRYFNMVGLSPNNRYICGHTRESKKLNGRQVTTNAMYILPVAPNGSLGKAKTFNLEGVSRVEQACFTPDSKAVVFTTKAGATFMRLDIATGALTTIMEHKPGQPGFRCYPEIIINSGGEMIAQGYFYDANDYAGRNAIAVINPYKTGVAAFTLANEIQKAQFSVRQHNRTYTENFPRKDVGFMTIHGDGYCNFYRWTAARGVQSYDKGKELLGAWGGGSRLLYTTKRGENNYDLCVYDANTDRKVSISGERKTPFTYVFLSADGKTAIFNDADTRQGVTSVYYARESEGWKATPVKGLSKKIASGAMRIADDGTKMLLHNADGIRVIDL